MRSTLLMLAAGMLVLTGCDGTPAQPSDEAPAFTAAPASTVLPDGHVPYTNQQMWDIVDEDGETIWQDFEAQPLTGGWFRLASNLLSGDPDELRECPLGEDQGLSVLNCDGWVITRNPDRSCANNDVYPIAQVSWTTTCRSVTPTLDPIVTAGPSTIFRVTAAPSAPGNRVFQRWEVSIGTEVMPCAEGLGSLTCTVSPTQQYPAGVMPFYRLVYGPQYAFSGFLAPVEGAPAVNVAKAGRAIPLKFRLGGDQGLAVLAAGSPTSQPVTCDLAPAGEQIETVAAAKADGLTYDAASDTYTYVWATEKDWSGTCRTLRMMLSDGETYEAEFRFTK
jgi:hypothetical protein